MKVIFHGEFTWWNIVWTADNLFIESPGMIVSSVSDVLMSSDLFDSGLDDIHVMGISVTLSQNIS